MAANALTDFSRIDRRYERDPFGWERVNSRLASEPNPVSDEEIRHEVRRYADYVAAFDCSRAASIPLAFAVGSRKDNLSNLDRWYGAMKASR